MQIYRLIYILIPRILQTYMSNSSTLLLGCLLSTLLFLYMAYSLCIDIIYHRIVVRMNFMSFHRNMTEKLILLPLKSLPLPALNPPRSFLPVSRLPSPPYGYSECEVDCIQKFFRIFFLEIFQVYILFYISKIIFRNFSNKI